MISSIAGEIIAVADQRVHLRQGSLVCEVLTPACDGQRLAASVGQIACFHTLLYLEGAGQGTSYFPRLIGFASPEERDFFELFTTVKGIGYRKALRAIQLPVASIARAIADKDTDLLVSLPEIGKRTAETIVAQLHGKVDRFVEIKPEERGAASGRGIAHVAAAALVQLGETRLRAAQLIDRALAGDPTIDTAERLIEAVYRLQEVR